MTGRELVRIEFLGCAITAYTEERVWLDDESYSNTITVRVLSR